MSRMFKRLAFAFSVPAVLAVGGWAQWTTLTADATVAASTADASRVDVLRERPDTTAADPRIEAAPVLDRTAGGGEQPSAPAVGTNRERGKAKIVTYRIKPAPIPDRTAGSGTQPPVPAVQADTELAQADAVTYPRIEPDPSPDRTARDGTTGPAERPTPAVEAAPEFAQAAAAPLDASIEPAPAAERGSGEKVAPAEQQPSSSLAGSPSTSTSSTNRSSTNRSSTTETKKERQAALPRETKEGRSTRDRERESESRRSKDDAANARKTIVAMRQKAEPVRYHWSGPATPALRDHPMRLRAWAVSSPATCH
jgi:hypothetical protein